MWFDEITNTKKRLSHKIRYTAKTVADASRSAAIEEVKEEGATDIGVSVDGTVRGRGKFHPKMELLLQFPPQINFKMVDVDAMSRYYRQACASKEGLRNK